MTFHVSPSRSATEPPTRRQRELEGAWLVASFLSGKPHSRDGLGAPDKTHDFDVTLNDGRTIALEVTSSTVREVIAMWAAIDACDWQCDELTQSWSVSLVAARRGDEGDSVKRFRTEGLVGLPCSNSSHRRCGDLVGGSIPTHFTEAGREAIRALRDLKVHSASLIGAMSIALTQLEWAPLVRGVSLMEVPLLKRSNVRPARTWRNSNAQSARTAFVSLG